MAEIGAVQLVNIRFKASYLNGNAYQGGRDMVRRSISPTHRTLAANPDRAEIMTDLERAIG